MIIDSNLVFWDNQDMDTWATGDHDSSIVTMPTDGSSNTGAKIISDQNMGIYISFGEAVAPGTASLLFALLGSTDGTTFRLLHSSPSKVATTFVKGYVLPFEGMAWTAWLYLRLRCTVAAGPLTAGHVTAGIAVNRQSARAGF